MLVRLVPSPSPSLLALPGWSESELCWRWHDCAHPSFVALAMPEHLGSQIASTVPSLCTAADQNSEPLTGSAFVRRPRRLDLQPFRQGVSICFISTCPGSRGASGISKLMAGVSDVPSMALNSLISRDAFGFMTVLSLPQRWPLDQIRQCLGQDPQLAEAHSISAFVRFVFDFDWLGAEREFLTAIELSPGSARAHEHYGLLCGALERYDDALREVQRARELDPLLVQTHVATTLLRAGRIDEALEEAQRSLRDTPGASRAHSSLGWALIFLGDHVAGIKSLERASALSPSSTLFLSQLGQAYGITGDVEGARKIVQQLQDRAVHEFVSPYHFAYVHAGLAEADKAIDWLERAFEQRSGGIYGIKGSFLFRNLRSHPRFKSLLQKMNLT